MADNLDYDELGKNVARHLRRPHVPEFTPLGNALEEKRAAEATAASEARLEREHQLRRSADEQRKKLKAPATNSAESFRRRLEREQQAQREETEAIIQRLLSRRPDAMRADVREALRAFDQAREQTADAHAKRAELDSKERELQAKTEREKRKVQQAAVAELIEGKKAPPMEAARQRIARNDEQLAAIELAREAAAKRIKAAEMLQKAAEARLHDAVVELAGHHHEVARAALQKALSALRPLLVQLLAADLVRDELCGGNFSFDHDRVRPISGAIVAELLLKGLPTLIAPENLTLETVKAEAKSAAAEMISELRGGNQ